MNSAAAAFTSADILGRTSSFLSKIIAQTDLRRGLVSIFLRDIPALEHDLLEALSLAAQTLDSAVSAYNPSARSSSLYLAEKLLLSKSRKCPSMSFLLSLFYTLCHQPANAALSLLDIFSQDPSLARSEIAPGLFEDLFLVHLIPVLQSFDDRRSRVLSSAHSIPSLDANYEFSCESSVVFPKNKLLSSMSGDQMVKLKELEMSYKEVIDENTRVLSEYFKEVLRDKDRRVKTKPPSLVFDRMESSASHHHSESESRNGIGSFKFESSEASEQSKKEDLRMKNGRYNPIWAEAERSVEFPDTNRSSLPSYPQRVSHKLLTKRRSSSFGSEPESPSSEPEAEDDNSAECSSVSSSSESEPEVELVKKENTRKMASSHKQRCPVPGESSSTTPDRAMSDSWKSTPPKDFVCPITSNVFDDPVTLETGQTYERRAIKEWLERGNSTCPITRQKLQSNQLPRTNYVLKRLIASWQEQNPGVVQPMSSIPTVVPEAEPKTHHRPSSPMLPSSSPTSVISALEGTSAQLRHAINKLCMSEILQESEIAVLNIQRFWREVIVEEADMMNMLTKPPVINGFVEILFNSVDPRVLRAAVFLLCELAWRDDAVVNTLTQVDSDVDCIVALFKKGLSEVAVLIYLLRPSGIKLAEMDIVDSLLTVVSTKTDEGDLVRMCVEPKTASVLLLGQILTCDVEEKTVSLVASKLVKGKVIESVMTSLEAEWAEERFAAVTILLSCIREDGKCRNIIADKVELALILESFFKANDSEKFEIIKFLSELVKLSRRSFNEQVLHIIKEEGAFSTMHILLNYLQMASVEHSPVVAGLLLQLDLLAEPRKMSIFREEAIDVLISCLRNTDFPSAQIVAAETIASLPGRFSISGKPMTRAFLLKGAGLDKKYRAIMRQEKFGNASIDRDESSEEKKAADDWERKIAYALVSHEFGLLFEALAEGLKSRYVELCSDCFLSATWLIHMLQFLPDTGVRGAARVCLLKRLVSIFKSAKDIEDRVLAMLALNTFIRDTEGLRDMNPYMKDVLKGLRELRKYSPLALEMMKILSEGNDSSADMWNHKELVHVECSSNGEVTSIVYFKDKIFSGHSDGTIKVWTGKGSILHLIQEVREHAKAVTSLSILPSGERLYSGSLDRTTKVWSIGNESIHSVEVHEMKDQVHNLVVANSIACFIPQGAGVKVHSWNGASKLLNPNKYVKCLSLVQGKLYCGCQDSSIQEIDLATGTLSSIQSGTRKLLGKSNPVQAIQLQGGLLYSVSSPLDGAAVKIWNASNYDLVGTLPSTSDIRSMAVSSELIYLGCKGGFVEVWCKEKHNRVETLQVGSNAKVVSMALDADEEFLVVGTSDGRIQAWGLS